MHMNDCLVNFLRFLRELIKILVIENSDRDFVDIELKYAFCITLR